MSRQKEKCVLVVDDDPDICDTMETVLDFHGYRVVTARSGPEALDKLRRGADPCLILLDLMMPGMSGAELHGELRRDAKLAAIPVVIISASGSVASKAAALGVEGLAKPVDLDQLLETIKRFGCAPCVRH
jgi:CheY-like chemotaxis protein